MYGLDQKYNGSYISYQIPVSQLDDIVFHPHTDYIRYCNLNSGLQIPLNKNALKMNTITLQFNRIYKTDN